MDSAVGAPRARRAEKYPKELVPNEKWEAGEYRLCLRISVHPEQRDDRDREKDGAKGKQRLVALRTRTCSLIQNEPPSTSLVIVLTATQSKRELDEFHPISWSGD